MQPRWAASTAVAGTSLLEFDPGETRGDRAVEAQEAGGGQPVTRREFDSLGPVAVPVGGIEVEAADDTVVRAGESDEMIEEAFRVPGIPLARGNTALADTEGPRGPERAAVVQCIP